MFLVFYVNKGARFRNCIGGTAPSLPAEVRVHFVLPVDAPQGPSEVAETDEAASVPHRNS